MSKDWVGRRKAERTTLMLKAWVTFFDDDMPGMEASVIDISKTGAKIEFQSPGPYPDEFNLSVIARNEQHIAKVRWQVNNQVGVEFISARSEDSIKSLVARVRSMERRFNALESGHSGDTNSADLSPVVQRLEEIETRLEAVAMEQLAPIGEGHDPLHERLAVLEQKLADLGTPAAPAMSPIETSSDVLDRLTRFEWRLDELTNDVHSRAVPAPVVAAPAVDQTSELARQVLYFGERLAGLEAAFQERSFRQFDGLTEAPSAAAGQDPEAEALGASLNRLAARVEQISRDLQRLQAEFAAPVAAAPSPLPAPVPVPASDDLRQDVTNLKSSVETLILAISMGLGRAAA